MTRTRLATFADLLCAMNEEQQLISQLTTSQYTFIQFVAGLKASYQLPEVIDLAGSLKANRDNTQIILEKFNVMKLTIRI